MRKKPPRFETAYKDNPLEQVVNYGVLNILKDTKTGTPRKVECG
jgi:hypothetical protein